jgi:hypothetical protein
VLAVAVVVAVDAGDLALAPCGVVGVGPFLAVFAWGIRYSRYIRNIAGQGRNRCRYRAATSRYIAGFCSGM